MGGERKQRERKEREKKVFPSRCNQYFYLGLVMSNLYPKLQQGVKLNEQL